MTEQDIRRYLRQMREDDSEAAFRSFYLLTYDRLFRIAAYYVKRDDWAQEVVLDAFMKLWERRTELPQVANIENYLFTVTKNTALNLLEKEERQSLLFDTDATPVPSELSDSPEEILVTEELFARYVKALDRLPDRCREVFIRLREQGQTYAQVAEAMGISEKTVDAQLQKALARLRKILIEE